MVPVFEKWDIFYFWLHYSFTLGAKHSCKYAQSNNQPKRYENLPVKNVK